MVLHRPIESTAVTVHVEYWAGICPIIRLYIQVEFVGENADFPQKESHGALGNTFDSGSLSGV
jgi:hypothetical protein